MSTAASAGGAGSPRPIGCCCAAGWPRIRRNGRRRSRSRPAPAGGSSWRSCSVPESRRIWPSRPTPPPPAGPSGGPRPTAPTPGTCASCWPAGGCPSPGSRPSRCFQMRARLQLFKDLLGAYTRRRLESGEQLSEAGRQAVATALRMLDALDAELVPLRRQIAAFARRQPGCKALQAQYGVGEITAVALWAELGDTRRFSSSRKAVRHTGLDITVYSSDGKRTSGRLSRQGSPLLRWALFEAAKCAARPGAPDHAYYCQVADRLGGNRAALSVARKIARRAHHTLRALGDEALAPV